MSEEKPRVFKLDDVVITKKKNNCPDCKVRVETYLKSVIEWQSAYDELKAKLEKAKEALSDARGWVVSYQMQTYSKAAGNCVAGIDDVLKELVC